MHVLLLWSQTENDAVAIRKSLQACSDLSLKSLSNPKRCVTIPWPTVLRPQGDRMQLTENTIEIDGREFFADLYRHVISHRKERRVNLMGTKGIGKSYRLAALVALLLKQVHFYDF